MVMCDPPYGTTVCKWDAIIPLEPMWRCLKRIVKANSAMVFTACQPFTSALVMSNVKSFKYCWVGDKVRPVGSHVCKYRPLAKHEDVAVFCLNSTKYNAQRTMRSRPVIGVKREYSRTSIIGGKTSINYGGKRYDTTREPTTIITVSNASNKGRLHPTQKPVKLMEYLIKTYTNEGDTVLDFAMGSGTTGVACRALGRKFIGIELDEKYFNIARERINETKRSRKGIFTE